MGAGMQMDRGMMGMMDMMSGCPMMGRGGQGQSSAFVEAFKAKTPVERLDAQLAAMEGRIKALQDLKPTLVKLYEELTAGQKRKADEILTAMGCMI
jgi:LTXXQ motif family protein